MATVVNARDVLLQATAPRVATVNASSNLVVDPSQVTGLGLVIEGTKLVTISATSQQFQVAKSGAVSPLFTTLTPVFRNISGAAVVSVTMGSIFPAPVYVGGVITINYTDLQTDAATVRVSVVDNGITYFDDMTIVKVREGTDGLVGYLTNEAVTLPADALGNVVSYATAGGTFKVFQGNNDVTAACTFTILANPSGLTFTLNPSTGVYLLNGGYGAGTDVTSITMRATLDIATGPDPVIDKVFTIAKSKAGTNGTSGSRGSRTFYVTLTGSSAEWSDAAATAVVSAAGGPILNDTVTESNDGAKFSQTRFWDGGVWAVVNAIVDGNLLVSGTVGASKITVNELTAIQASLGTAVINANGFLRSAGATSYGVGNGFFLGWETGDYRFRIGNPATGPALWWDGTNLAITGNATFSGVINAASGQFRGSVAGGVYTGWVWPPAGAANTGFYLGPEGLLIGNANNGRYFQVYENGDIDTPGFNIINGAATFRGRLTTGAINVSTAAGSDVKFYDTNQGPNWEVRTSAQSSLFNIYVDAGYYDGTYGTYFPTVITGAELSFTTGNASTPLNRRLRVGTVRFSIVATAMIDEHFTLWWRTQGGAWAYLTTIDETQTSYGTGALCYSFDVGCYNGLTIDFGISSGNQDTGSYGTYGLFADPGKRNIQHGAVTVTAVNF